VVAVRTACSFGEQPLGVPESWPFGRLIVPGSRLRLTPAEVGHAAAALEHAATFTMALTMAQALKDCLPRAREHSDPNAVAAFEVSRLLRNAYAHQPMAPVWHIDAHCRGKQYEVAGLIRLDTTTLDGRDVVWEDYGGLLALFEMSRWIRLNILGDTEGAEPPYDNRKESSSVGQIYQTGRLLVRGVPRGTAGAIDPREGPVIFDTPEGPYTWAMEGDDRPPRHVQFRIPPDP